MELALGGVVGVVVRGIGSVSACVPFTCSFRVVLQTFDRLPRRTQRARRIEYVQTLGSEQRLVHHPAQPLPLLPLLPATVVRSVTRWHLSPPIDSTTLSIAQTTYRGVMGWLMNSKRYGRKQSWPRGTEENHKKISQNSRSPGRDSNPGPSERVK